MSEKLKPNFTPVPNVILDEIMRGINESEFKVLMAICRFTYGWGKQSDRISLSQLGEIAGIRDRSNVHRAIKRLGSLLDITPGDQAKNLASEYRINVDISEDLLSDLLSPVTTSKENQRKKIVPSLTALTSIFPIRRKENLPGRRPTRWPSRPSSVFIKPTRATLQGPKPRRLGSS
jgi:phage replication O-like protein O